MQLIKSSFIQQNLMRGTRTRTAMSRIAIVEKLAGNNDPVNVSTLINLGFEHYDAKATLLALTHPYTKREHGFNLPQSFENNNGYLHQIVKSKKESYFVNLAMAITYEKSVLLAKKEIRKEIIAICKKK